MIPRVYLDSCVFKFSATQLLRLRPRKKVINWGGKLHNVTIHHPIYINPNDDITNPELKREVDLLPELLSWGKQEN